MWYSALLLLASCLAITNAATFTMTSSSYASVTAGSNFVISWTSASGSVTILLKNGPANELKTLETIATGLTGTSYIWTTPSTLPSATDYSLEIVDSDGINYSAIFAITGGPVSTASSTATVIETSTISFPTLPSASTITSSAFLSSDFQTSQSVTIVSQATNTGSTLISSSTSINENQTNTAASNSGLSAAAKAGIGVGVAFGVICLAGLGVLLFVSGRRSATRDAVSDLEKADLATDEATGRDARAELADGVQGAGYSDVQGKTELAEGTPRAELCG